MGVSPETPSVWYWPTSRAVSASRKPMDQPPAVFPESFAAARILV
jgi:hypothetical protein